MGAGARLAAERDRWPDHWQVADLEQEEERLLGLLDPAEELRAAVPGLRTSEYEAAEQVLIGITDRRVLVIGRRQSADATWEVGAPEHAACAAFVDRSRKVAFDGGRLELDLDDEALARVWAQLDGLFLRAAGCG